MSPFKTALPSKARNTVNGEGGAMNEAQFILRLPPAAARRLRGMLGGPLEDSLSIGIDADTRAASVVFAGTPLSGKLYDLPCIVESHKTLDGVQFYKTGDIAQILVCDDAATPAGQRASSQWEDGLTGPMRAARTERFRECDAAQFLLPEAERLATEAQVELEVKRLLRAEAAAASTHYYFPGAMTSAPSVAPTPAPRGAVEEDAQQGHVAEAMSIDGDEGGEEDVSSGLDISSDEEGDGGADDASDVESDDGGGARMRDESYGAEGMAEGAPYEAESAPGGEAEGEVAMEEASEQYGAARDARAVREAVAVLRSKRLETDRRLQEMRLDLHRQNTALQTVGERVAQRLRPARDKLAADCAALEEELRRIESEIASLDAA